MYCLDWTEDILLHGNERNDEYTRIEVVLNPCNYIHSHLGYEGDRVHPDCIPDLDKQIEYLGPINFIVYHTEDKFSPVKFDEASIL